MIEKNTAKLSIIIVHYFTAEILFDCIDSIYQENKRLSFEIIVVNNGSYSEFNSQLNSKFPEVIIIDMDYNAGFARANNAGIRIAKGEYILLLNSDTIVIDHALEKCIHLFSHDKAISCGVQLLNRDKSLQISGSYFIKGGLNFLLPLPYLGNLIRWIAYKFKTKVPSLKQAESRHVVDWINGAFLMIKREVIEQVGLLDEDFFLYAEESEWCSRIKKRGELVIYGDINIVHLEGGSSNNFFGGHDKGYYSLIDKRGKQLIVSNMLRIRKQYGIMWFLLMLGFYLFEIPVFLIGNIITLPFHMNSIIQWLKAPILFTGNMLSLCWLTPRILLNKPYFYKVI